MTVMNRKYSDQAIIIFIAILLVLMVILLTERHMAEIDREIKQTMQR